MGTSNLCLFVQFFEKQEKNNYQTVYNNRLLDIMPWEGQWGHFTPLRTIDITLYSDRLQEMYLVLFMVISHQRLTELHHTTLSLPILERSGGKTMIKKKKKKACGL